MSDLNNSILEVNIELSNIMKDLRVRVNHIYDLYTNQSTVIKLPKNLNDLKSSTVRYDLSRKLVDSIDDLNEMKLRVGLVYRSLDEYKNFQPKSKADYNVAVSFREGIKSYLEELTQYKFDLTDLIKNANNKLRVIDSYQFFDM
jgi:uncharacterized coiled-coil DUF342 family protein